MFGFSMSSLTIIAANNYMTANGHTLCCGTEGDCISINELYIDFATTLPPESTNSARIFKECIILWQ